MIAKGIKEDSITKLPRNQIIENEIIRSFLAILIATMKSKISTQKANSVDIGWISEEERGKS